MKNLACLPLFVLLAVSALPASTVGWVNGMFIPNDSAYQAAFGGTSAGNGAFMGAMPQPVPEPEPDPEVPAPTPAVSPLTLTEDGLLSFVFQSLYADLSAAEQASMRVTLAPQYAALAAYLQGMFGGATEVTPDPTLAPPPATEPVPDRPAGGTVTDSMAVVAATALLAPEAGPVVGEDAPILYVPGLTDVTTFDTAVVPEPSTMLLLGSALVAAGLSRRRSG